jgi:hypothetical protein
MTGNESNKANSITDEALIEAKLLMKRTIAAPQCSMVIASSPTEHNVTKAYTSPRYDPNSRALN